MQLKTSQLKLSYGLNSAIAFTGFVIQFIINLFDLVPIESEYPTLLGGHPAGAAGIFGRLTDSFSYFTIWSNLVVAIVLFLLYQNPDRNSFRFKVLRLDSLLMITITGAVYHILIRPYYPPVSWNVYSDIFLHTITPIVTISIWILVGPRNWISKKIVFYSLLIPIFWLGYTLIRGEIINKYPYDFLDVITLGYMTVLVTIIILVAIGLLIALSYLLLEKLISKKS
jgi:hypothetical protein